MSTALAMPYPGLRPFEAEDQPLFFGREAQMSGMLRQLEDHRFVAVVGSSGSGKSSLVRAGLLPAVQDGFLLGTTDWLTIVIKPGHQPYQRLVRALARATCRPDVAQGTSADDAPLTPEETATLATLRRTDRGLLALLGQMPISPESRVIVVVDQFEELFAFRRAGVNRDTVASRDEAAAFVGMLLRSTSEPEGRVWVILTMRSDFIGDCEAFLGLPEQISHSQFLVPRLDRGQMEEAIRRPGAVGGGAFRNFTFEDGLVNRIINDAGDRPDQLPLMQHALMRTWKRAVARAGADGPVKVTPEDYEAAGGIDMALSLHADAAWDEIKDDPKKADLARRLFLLLCDVSPDGQITRRRPQVAEIQAITGASVADIEQIVRLFQQDDRNFLLPPPPQPLSAATFLDISHEALLRQWRRFAGEWQDRERRDASELRRLAELASLRKQGQGVGLLPAQDLERIARWKQRVTAEWARRYVAREDWDEALRFVVESQAAAERERAEEREEAERRRQEEARQKQAEQRKKFLYAVAGILLVAMGFSVWQMIAARMAQDSAQDALTRSFVSAIGTSRSGPVPPVERDALWELAKSDSAMTRRKLIAHWCADKDRVNGALVDNARGLHTATGTNPDLRTFSELRAQEAVVGKGTAIGLVAAIGTKDSSATSAARLSCYGDALVAVPAWMNADHAGELAEDLATKLEKSDAVDADRLAIFGNALAAAAARMTAPRSATVANRGAQVLASALKTPSETDAARWWKVGSALAALAPRMRPEDAERQAQALAKVLENSQKISAVRLAGVGTALAALAAQMEAPKAAVVVKSGAEVFVRTLETPPETDAGNLWNVGPALAALASRMEATDALSFATRLGAVLVDPKTTDPSQVSALGTALAALAPRIEASDARTVARRLTDLFGNPDTTDPSLLPALGAAVAVLAARVNPEDAARLAEPLAKALENPQETLGVRLWSFGPALAALAPRMNPKDATGFATRLTKALVNPQETNGDRLWGLRSALSALIAMMDAEAAAEVANGLILALEKSPDTVAARQWSLGSALAAAAAQMRKAKPEEAEAFAVRGARVFADALSDPKETDGGHLANLGRTLGALLAVLPKDRPVRQTRLLALANSLLSPVPELPKNGEAASQERKQLADLFAQLTTEDLAEVLKWPFCVGEAQKLALTELEKRTGGKFNGDLREFVQQFESLTIKDSKDPLPSPAFLKEPAKQPRIKDAFDELDKLKPRSEAQPGVPSDSKPRTP